MKYLTPQIRTYLYGVITAAMPLLISLGLFTEGVAKDVTFLVAAVLGMGANIMAAANVTPKPPIS